MITSRPKRHWVMAAVAASSLFLSQQPLAEPPCTCAHYPDKSEISCISDDKKVKTYDISPAKKFSEKLGNLLTYSCDAKHAFMIFENGLVKTDGNRGNIIEFSGAVKAVIKWNSTAAIILRNGSVMIFKNISGETPDCINTPKYSGIDPVTAQVSISGGEDNTVVKISSNGKTVTLVISKNSKNGFKINEEIENK